jgi:hypothetical protein
MDLHAFGSDLHRGGLKSRLLQVRMSSIARSATPIFLPL